MKLKLMALFLVLWSVKAWSAITLTETQGDSIVYQRLSAGVPSLSATSRNVYFVDANGNEVNVEYGLFNASVTAGAVKSRGVGMLDAAAVTKTLVPGGYSDRMRASKFFSSVTTSGMAIHARL